MPTAQNFIQGLESWSPPCPFRQSMDMDFHWPPTSIQWRHMLMSEGLRKDNSFSFILFAQCLLTTALNLLRRIWRQLQKLVPSSIVVGLALEV